MEAYVNVEGCILCFEGVGEITPGVSDNLTEGNAFGVLLANVELERLYTGKKMEVKDLYYNLGQWRLKKESKKELDKVIVLMQDNPNINLELGSHTDSQGSKSTNMALSQKRANAAVQYLARNGVQGASRISSKGYGESTLKNKCADGVKCTSAQHAENRRTELKITGITNVAEIKSLKKMKEEEFLEQDILAMSDSEQIQVRGEEELKKIIAAEEKEKIAKEKESEKSEVEKKIEAFKAQEKEKAQSIEQKKNPAMNDMPGLEVVEDTPAVIEKAQEVVEEAKEIIEEIEVDNAQEALEVDRLTVDEEIKVVEQAVDEEKTLIENTQEITEEISEEKVVEEIVAEEVVEEVKVVVEAVEEEKEEVEQITEVGQEIIEDNEVDVLGASVIENESLIEEEEEIKMIAKVVLFVSDKELEEDHDLFKKFSNLEVSKEKDRYQYMLPIGSENLARRFVKNLNKRIYPDAYVTTFKEGDKAIESDIQDADSSDVPKINGVKVIVYKSETLLPKDHKIFSQFETLEHFKSEADGKFHYMVPHSTVNLAKRFYQNLNKKKFKGSYIASFSDGILSVINS